MSNPKPIATLLGKRPVTEGDTIEMVNPTTIKNPGTNSPRISKAQGFHRPVVLKPAFPIDESGVLEVRAALRYRLQ